MCEQILKKRQRPNTTQILWMLKIIAGQVLKHNSKNFHWNKKKKLDLERTVSEFGTPFRKIQIKNWKKNRKKQS